MPTLDLLEVKAKLDVSTLVLDIQLNRVDFPTLATPIIPHLSAILCKIWLKIKKKEAPRAKRF
jgi:hypothetical protein